MVPVLTPVFLSNRYKSLEYFTITLQQPKLVQTTVKPVI